MTVNARQPSSIDGTSILDGGSREQQLGRHSRDGALRLERDATSRRINHHCAHPSGEQTRGQKSETRERERERAAMMNHSCNALTRRFTVLVVVVPEEGPRWNRSRSVDDARQADGAARAHVQLRRADDRCHGRCGKDKKFPFITLELPAPSDCQPASHNDCYSRTAYSLNLPPCYRWIPGKNGT